MIRKIRNFIQRGTRGYSDEDLWDFDLYLAKIISTGLEQFKKSNHGIPCDIHDKYPTNDELATKEWDCCIDAMIYSFKMHIDLLDEPKNVKDEYKAGYELGFNLS